MVLEVAREVVETSSIWFKVLVACYKEECGRMKEGGKLCSRWWRDIAYISRGAGMGINCWFNDNLVWVVGDGTNIFSFVGPVVR